MSSEYFASKLKMFGRFPKTNFSIESSEFIEEYLKIISSDELFDELLSRMLVRYGKNEPIKSQIIEIVKGLNNFHLNEDKLRETLNCDKNIIFSIGQDIDISIRLFAKKFLLKQKGIQNFMIDEFGFTSKTFNYLYKRGYTTKSEVLQAVRNGYIKNEKAILEIKKKLLVDSALSNSENERAF